MRVTIGTVNSSTDRLQTAVAATGWLWLLPRLAFILFVAAVLALLWMSERAEREEQRGNLLSDVLWLEQNLRFQFTRHEEILGQIDPVRGTMPAAFAAQAKVLLGSKTGLRLVAWLDAEQNVRRLFPGDTNVGSTIEPNIPQRETSRLARSLGRAAYSPAYMAGGDDWHFEVHVPVFDNDRFAGIAVGIYSIQRLLDDSIPWWLAERYRIGVADNAGNMLATRSKVEATEDASSSYQIPFEPPGHGLVLQAVPYRTPTPLVGRLLSVALVVLALIVLWSLWALRRREHLRQAAEEALRNEYAFRQAMENSLHTGMRALGLDGRITYVNPAFCRMVGFSPEELLGSTAPQPFWPPEEYDNIRAALAAARSANPPTEGIEMRLQRRNGERFDALLYEAPLIDAEGKHTGWMGSLLDITERKRIRELARQQEEKLAATARLVAMGEMASSLAHELNQPLAAIASYNAGCLNLVDSGCTDPGDLRDALAKSIEQAQRAGRIIRRIYEFVRRSEPKTEPCDLNRILDELLVMVEVDARRQRIVVVRDIASDLPAVNGDSVLLTQALLNLMRNAIDAMRDATAERRSLQVGAASDGGYIEIRIEDRGCGIAEDATARLFEPFFTTKPEGMGMGLNICRSVIEAHRGRLSYEPNPRGGSIFRVQLPLNPA